MQTNFIFNHLSLPAADKVSGHAALLDAMKGMLAYLNLGDRPIIYGDGKTKLSDFEIAKDYRFGDFINELEKIDPDLQLTLFEIEDKTPMLDFLNEDQINSIANQAFYFPDEGYATTIDILGVAWELDAVLLSLNTSKRWSEYEVCFAKHSETPMLGYSYLDNISKKSHGEYFFDERKKLSEKGLIESFPTCKFSDEFIEWTNGLASNLLGKVKGKLSLAAAKQFSGGGPLFDSLENADGMREVRFSNTEGGAVRIIFKDLTDKKHAILFGFIKKSDNDGYDQAIIASRKILKKMTE